MKALKPELFFLFLLAALQLGFWQELQDPFQPIQMAWLKTLGPLAFVALAWSRPERFSSIYMSQGGRLLLLWVAWLLLRSAYSPSPAVSLKNAYEQILCALFFAAPAFLALRERRLGLWLFLAGGTVAVAYGAFQHFGVDPWRWSTDFAGRPLGTLGNPNFFGGHIVLAWAASLGLLIFAPSWGPGLLSLAAAMGMACLALVFMALAFGFAKFEATAGKALLALALASVVLWLFGRWTKARPRWAAGLLFALISLVQLWSWTLGVWIGMASAALGLALFMTLPAGIKARERFRLKTWHVPALLALILVLGFGLFVSVPGQRAWERFKTYKSASVTNRILMWKTAIDLWKTRPVDGIGLTQFRRQFPDAQARLLVRDSRYSYVVTWLPHQNYLYILSELGALGFLLFLGFWILPFKAGWQRLKQLNPEAHLAAWGLLGLAGVSLMNTFSNIVPTQAAFFYLAGLLYFAPGAMGTPVAAARGLSLGKWATLAVLSLALAWPAWREVAAHRLIRDGLRAKKRGDLLTASKLLEKAGMFGIRELNPQTIVGVWYEHAEVRRQGGDLPGAAQSYAKDLEENPHAPETHNMLGAALGQLGRPVEAAGLLRRAVELSPGYSSALINLGIAYATAGNLSDAAKTWHLALKFEPDNKEVPAYLLELKKMKKSAK